MKQQINLGQVVDDGTGDYLRRGGEKINANFDDIYSRLGDGQEVHPAGAWARFRFIDSGNTLNVKFGDAWVIDTHGGIVNVVLPKGTSADYGKVIRLRDVNGIWDKYPVRLVIQTGDTVKGQTGTYDLNRKGQDVELTYTQPSRFEFPAQKLVDGISFGATPSVKRAAWIAAEGDRDFNTETVLGGEYNVAAVEVYRRGNLLYYGNDGLSDASDYGSIPDPTIPDWATATDYTLIDRVKYSGNWYQCVQPHNSGSSFVASNWEQINNGDLFPLDGKTIRLRIESDDGDPIAVVTYLTDVSSFRTSYNKMSVMVADINNPAVQAVDGQIVKIDLENTREIPLTAFGYPEYTQYNPTSLEVLVNGQHLTIARQAGQGYEGSGNFEFDVKQDASGRYNIIVFGFELEHKDIVTVRWYDSVIGTLLSWDEGDDTIQDRADARYLQTLYQFTRKNKIRYTDPNNPSAANTEIIPDAEEDIRFGEVTSLLESIYPVGSVYINANNPNNPADYMGFGKWVRFGEGRAIVAWQDANDQGEYDPDFGYNNQFLDDQGQPIPAAGGQSGSKATMLTAANIPELTSGVENKQDRNPNNPNEQYALVARPNDGDLNLNGCQPDPDSTAPVLGFYREEPVKVNAGATQTSVSVVQPSITVHVWVRTE
ncbi:baseplate wedge subunit [Vibrio phage EniLVp02]